MPKELKLSDYYIPLPKQLVFHESTAKYKLFMGGVGSGKTMALDWEALLLSLEYPGNYGLIGRLYYPELRDTTMHDFFEICPPEFIKEWKKTENKLTLFNNSIIIFRALEDVDKLKSLNLGWFGIDEMTEVPEDVFLMLQSRLRRTNVPRRVGFGSTNPEGHDWVYKRFAVKHKTDPNYLMVNVASTENPHLPDDYVSDLLESYDEVWVKRYIHGDPSAFEGQIVSEWDPSIHVIKPFEIPENWNRTVTLDHGTNNPTACIWSAVHPDGFLIVYREHYHAGQIIEWHAKQIFQLNGSDNVYLWLADPATFNRTLQDPKRGLYSVADVYAELGIHFAPGDNDVKAGIDMLKRHFWVDPAIINPFTEKKGSPRIFIFNNCEHTIEEIPQYRWKRHRIRSFFRNQPEEPEKHNDHAVDCVRYTLMAKPQPTKDPKVWKGWPTKEDRMWDRLEKISRAHAIENKSKHDFFNEENVAERKRIRQAMIEDLRKRRTLHAKQA